MAGTSQQAPAGARAQDESWGRPDTVLLALTATALILLAVQFALAGFGAFTMVTSPAADAYGAHIVLGVVIGALHALNGLAICALAGWLLAATRRRQANHRAGPGSHR